MDINQLYNIYRQHPVICTDTRKILPNCLFFALKGDTFDANSFAEEALKKGAAYVVIDNPDYKLNDQFILTDDALITLQNLARHHRNQLQIPFIGITGTNGKTTTKELINSVLKQRYKTYATQGNLNNHIGVPLTILSISAEIEIAIIEMGANHQKEIEFLCSMAQPTHGLITNVGKAHLEGFGGYEGVKIAKGELYAFLANHNGICFINRDNHELVGMSRLHNVLIPVYYGTGADSFVNGYLLESSPDLVIEWQPELMEVDDLNHLAKSHLTGTYNLENILAAICIGSFFDLSPQEVNAGVESYVPSNNRSQLIKTETNIIIGDYYNANPSSMAVALDNFSTITADKKVIILGDMFELGADSEAEHTAVVKKAMKIEASRRIFIGESFFKLSNSTDATFYRSTADAYEAIKSNPIKSSSILIKGSRGMKMENLIELF